MTTPLTTFSGIASGIDSATLIKSLVEIARTPATRLESQKAAINVQSKKLTDVRTRLTTLQSAAKALDTRSEALLMKATSSAEGVAKVKTAGGSSLGSFDLTVTALAKAERTYSDGVSASDQTGLFGVGTLNIQVGTNQSIDLAIDGNDTLETVVDKINNSGVGVTAGITYTGTEYRIQVNGNTTGAANAISFTESGGLTLGLSNIANQVQAAQDASVLVDGFTVTGATNSLSGVIPGVTLDLVSTGTASITLDRDPDALKTKVEAFVSAYNDITRVMNAEFTYSGITKGPESLAGDSGLRGIQTKLREVVSQQLSGLGTTFSTLASIGISSQRDGSLSLDADKLKSAIASDYAGVTSLLSSESGTVGFMGQISAALDPIVSADGSLKARLNSMSSHMGDIDDQISRVELRLDKYEEGLRNQFAALESLIGGLNAQGQALTSMIAANSGSK